jgi:hypothetical protein
MFVTHELTPAERRLVQLVVVEGLTNAEIGGRLHRTVCKGEAPAGCGASTAIVPSLRPAGASPVPPPTVAIIDGRRAAVAERDCA